MSAVAPVRAFQAPRQLGRASLRTATYLVPAVTLGLAFGAYFVLRYLGLWTEQDTEVFVRIITDMKQVGSLRSPGAYTHGYAYPVWATTLSNLTGLSVTSLLQLYTPLLGNLFLALFGYAAFRRLLASERLGLIATSVLFLIPELVFTMSRGNHEKLTVSMTLFAILALVNSMTERQRGRVGVAAGWASTFYLSAFTLATLNIFFGSSLVVALSVMLVVTTLVVCLRPNRSALLRPVVRRLALAVGINWLLVVLVMWYVYPQSSGTHEHLISTAAERLTSLLHPTKDEMSEETFTISDPYAVGGTDWANLSVYRLVSSFRWVLFSLSFPTWLVLFVRTLYAPERLSIERLFLLGLYGAFGFVLALAIPIDFLNLSAGTNLQVRIYTYFVLSAAPLLAFGLGWVTDRARSQLFHLLLTSLFGLLFCSFGVLSLLKATLDPMLSNRWLFYHPAEVQAAHFWDLRHERRAIWMDVEGRLRYAYTTVYPEAYPKGSISDNHFGFGPFVEGPPYALHSSILQETAIAWQLTPATLWLENRPYDNGEAQIYHRIPRTPFQQ